MIKTIYKKESKSQRVEGFTFTVKSCCPWSFIMPASCSLKYFKDKSLPIL